MHASYAVHPDFKSHTGSVVSRGHGGIYDTSTCQKINAEISTEKDLIGVAKALPQVLWTRYFLKAQGFHDIDTVIHQANKSTILFCNNGIASSSKHTFYVNDWYFFVADRVAQKGLRIEYCPNQEMIADFFTKTLQGALFIKFRNFIMNIALVRSQECVEQ